MVSKPGTQEVQRCRLPKVESEQYQLDSLKTKDPNVLVLNTLTSLTEVLKTVFSRQENQVERTVERSSNQAKEVDPVTLQTSQISRLCEIIERMFAKFKELNEAVEVVIKQNQRIVSEFERLSDEKIIEPVVAATRTDEISGKRSRLNNSSTTTIGGKKRSKREKLIIRDEDPIDLGLPDLKIDSPEFDGSKFVALSEKEVLQKLHEEETKRKQRQRLPEKLTEVEQNLAKTDFARLAREWRRRLGFTLKDYDFRDLGKLNEKQIQLPRRAIMQILRRRRRVAHIEAAKEEGIEILQCDICEEQYVKDRGHSCFVTSWVTPASRGGLPHKKQVVVSQSGKGAVKIGQQYAIDKNKLEKERERMTQYRVTQDDSYNKDVSPRQTVDTSTDTPMQIESIDQPSTSSTAIVPTSRQQSQRMTKTVVEEGEITEISDSPLYGDDKEVRGNLAYFTPEVFYAMMFRQLQDAHSGYFYEALSEEYAE